MSAPVWIIEADVTALIALPDAVAALERTLALEAEGRATSMPKTHLMVAKNDAMHAIGAAVAGAGLCGTKTWINVGGKSETVLVLFSLDDGRLRAVIEATALGQMRTAAMTGVGTRRLAAADADELAVIGSGKQALPQVAACAAVRTLRHVRVHSRRPEAREAFAEAVRKTLGLRVTACASVAEAVRDCPIVTLITNATEPFFTAAMAAKGAHINAMGAIVPARIEITQDIFPRCAVVAVDTIEGVRELSAEFRARYGEDARAWAEVRPISALIAAGASRPAGADLTLFKAIGMGLADLALGAEILARTEKRGGAHRLPERVKVPPRLV
ncbi:MAG: ornithine cyclodeaminase family protein [Alphaproteobacteria bacterium]|nr:ornithine cyclodeaminase family protein [Alphaproteobacteria bacterium]